jgi:DNA polymerase-3 subunit gamma/tau
MSYQVLARKWRPRRFSEIVGQEHVVRALYNALAHGRLHHAYLFTGTRGVGKTTLARIFARALNCEQGVTPEPCGNCVACKEIDEGRFVDLLEVDAASRTKVDQTRELLDNVPYAPVRGRYKVYLIDEVHMFSGHSFNALLKTLEEPPPHVKFLLATTDPQKLPVTILSRCLQFNLKRLLPEQIEGQLAAVLEREGIEREASALHLLARAADGSMRDGLSLLDQAIAYGSGRVAEADVRGMLGTLTQDLILELGRALAEGNAPKVLDQVARMAEHTPDFAGVLSELLRLLHRIALAQWVPEAAAGDAPDAPGEAALAAAMAPEDVQLYYQIGLLGQRDLELAPDPRTGLEMVLLRMLAFRPASDRVGAAVGGTSDKAAEVPEIEAVVPETDPQVPPADGARAAPVRLSGSEDWHALVAQLRLGGVASQLASNCELDSWDGKTLRLRLDPACEHLRVASAEQRFGKALQDRLGLEARMVLSVDRPESETPAQREARRRAERQTEAERAIENDPLVRALQEGFDARVVAGSIKPLDPQPKS